MLFKQQSFSKILSTAFFFAFLLAIAFSYSNQVFKKPGLGLMGDFKLYWTAFQVAAQGGNPYHSSELLHKKAELKESFLPDFLFLNSPLVLVMLSPVFFLPYKTAIFIWIFLNLLLLFQITRDLPELYPKYEGCRLAVYLFSSLPLIPLAVAFREGQLSLFMTYLLIKAALAIRRRQDFTAGCFFAGTLIKFHCTWLVYPFIFIWALKENRKSVIYGFTVSFLILLGLIYSINDQLITSWMSQTKLNAGLWDCPCLINLVRIPLIRFLSYDPKWILPAVMLTAFFSILACYLGKKKICLEKELPLIISLSVMSTFYLWYHDLFILVILQAALFSRLKEKRWAYLFCALNLLFPFLMLFTDLLGFALYAPILMLVYGIHRIYFEKSERLRIFSIGSAQ